MGFDNNFDTKSNIDVHNDICIDTETDIDIYIDFFFCFVVVVVFLSFVCFCFICYIMLHLTYGIYFTIYSLV